MIPLLLEFKGIQSLTFLFVSRSLPLHSLSKFAMCISDHQLKHSPLMGRITDVVARKLSTIDDAMYVPLAQTQ